ncbi:MAG: hypothetical protein OXO50_05515 [Caldilineaceae bacterium]|nr:hypothetical protein [Caldilineaceae bacterium]
MYYVKRQRRLNRQPATLSHECHSAVADPIFGHLAAAGQRDER